MKKILTILLTSVLAGGSLSYAAYPLFVDDAAILAPAEVEVVTYYDLSYGSDERWHTFPAEVTYGLHPRADLTLGSGYQVLDEPETGERTGGFLDTVIALKVLAFEQGNSPFAFTAEGSVKLPTASERRGLGSGEIDLGLQFAATREWRDTALDVNLGYLFAEHLRGRRNGGDDWFLGFAIRHATTNAMETFFEVFSEAPVGYESGAILTTRIGANWEIRDGISFGAGIGPSFGPGSPDFHATAGATWSF